MKCNDFKELYLILWAFLDKRKFKTIFLLIVVKHKRKEITMNSNLGVTLWRDLNPVYGLRNELDHLFKTSTQFVPACEIEEGEDSYLISLEMAGVKKDDIQMEVMDRKITISGERKDDSRFKEERPAYSERRFGKFQRTFSLPSDVDSNQVEADYQDGVLRVFLPKAESAKPRQIKITQGNGSSKFFSKLLGQHKEDQRVAQKVAS